MHATSLDNTADQKERKAGVTEAKTHYGSFCLSLRTSHCMEIP